MSSCKIGNFNASGIELSFLNRPVLLICETCVEYNVGIEWCLHELAVCVPEPYVPIEPI